MKRTILDRIRDIINPPYLIDDSPEIKVYNPRVELVDIDEYRFKIITSKNSNTNIADIKKQCEVLANILSTLEPYVDVFQRRIYTIEIYEAENSDGQHGYVDDKNKRLTLNKDYLNMATHEFGHIIDNHSNDPEFSSIKELYKNNYNELREINKTNHTYERYILQNNEIFARLFQQYYLNNFKLPDDFKNIEIDTGEEVAINVYNNNKEIINEYFDNQFLKYIIKQRDTTKHQHL